jgi:hypothetical protein
VHGSDAPLSTATAAAAQGQLDGVAQRAVFWKCHGCSQPDRQKNYERMQEERKERGETATAFSLG